MVIGLTPVAQAVATLVGGLQHCDPRNQIISLWHPWSPLQYHRAGGIVLGDKVKVQRRR